MLRYYSFLLYLLSIIVGFFLGVIYAGWIEAGKGQMLAAGAIVVGYGVMGAFIGLVVALALTYWGGRRTIIGLNVVLALLVIGFFIYFTINYNRRQAAKSINIMPETELPRKMTIPDKLSLSQADQYEISYEQMNMKMVEVANYKSGKSTDIPLQPEPEMGLGMFSPHLILDLPLYFYTHPGVERLLSVEDIADSVTFHMDQHGNLAIGTAPPWFVPTHEKIDYGFMFLKIRTMYRHAMEVEVNAINGQTSIVSIESGEVSLWPEFILSVYSIELLETHPQTIKVKPLDYAGEIGLEYEFLRPIAIRADWIQVELKNSNLEMIGEGWVKWRENGRLLVSYSLMS